MVKVRLLAHTPNPEKVIAIAARLCYSDSSIDKLEKDFTPDKVETFIKKIIKLGHESVLEHAVFTFAIEGISRACSHQLVRHRLASYSQQSQRYVNFSKFENVIPASIKSNACISNKVSKYLDSAEDLYILLINAGIPAEDARFILPNASTTKIIVTMNLRQLKHFFQLRCCNRSQWEIRFLAIEMLKVLKHELPILFSSIGPKCLTGKCPEGEMSCGQADKVKEFFSNL